MAATMWRFRNPSGGATYTFAYNPKDVGAVARDKDFAYEHTGGPSSGTVILERGVADDVREFHVTTLTQAAYEAFVTWFNIEDPIELRDHFLREYLILIEEVSAPRKRALDSDWVHDVTVRYWVLDELTVTAPAFVVVSPYQPNLSLRIYEPKVNT